MFTCIHCGKAIFRDWGLDCGEHAVFRHWLTTDVICENGLTDAEPHPKLEI